MLVRYSSSLARSVGVSPLIVGLTVISIGTSLPEFVVSLIAATQNTMGISIGNIIGSNIANIGLILGSGALLANLKVKKSWVYKEVPIMIFATIIFIIFARTGFEINRLEGAFLFFLLLLFLAYLSRLSLSEMRDFQEIQLISGDVAAKLNNKQKILYLVFSIAGIILLVFGSKATVTSGANIAQALGVDDTVIGLTLIAVGTSLPELATTIVGVLHKETDLVVGNILGSNIFNLLFIGGLVPLVRPIPVSQSLFSVEFPYLIILSILILPVMRTKWKVHRWEGISLLIIYIVFIGMVFGA